MQQEHFLMINEQGELLLPGSDLPIKDLETTQELLRNLKLSDNFTLETHFENTKYIVEAFDHPLVAHSVENRGGRIFIQTQAQLFFEVDPKKWSVDDWDRFCGLTTTAAPFRLTERAQEKLFDACDEFDDESFTLGGLRIETPPYYIPTDQIDTAKYWMDVYHTDGKPGWDLGEPAEAFKDMYPRLKLPKCRILVLACGEGHDAAMFAQAGHVVTAVDFSGEGLTRGKKLYGHLENLTFMKEDIFNLPQSWNHSFDVIVEHTCFCAIPPERRKDLVTLWRRLLHEEGQIFGVFFAMLKRAGPPYGSSEWEIRELLRPYFQFLFWSRWRKSLPRRQGKELFILAKKREL